MPKSPSFHRTLWVDAICINQNDVVERGHQVRLMRDIFSRAKRVVVWLGSSRQVENCLTEIKKGPLVPRDIDQRLQARYTAEWGIYIARIFDQPWFQRVWVIQEVVFATKVIVLGVTTSIKWRQLVDAAVVVKCNTQVTAIQRIQCDSVLGIECLRHQIRTETDAEPNGEGRK